MKSVLALSLAALVAAAPTPQSDSITAATVCPDINGAQVLSNNNQAYKLSCAKWIDSDSVIRITETEIGYQGCLTACDGTIGCGVVQYIATDDAQTKGSCTIFPESELKDGASNSWTVAVPVKDPTTTSSAAASATPTSFGGIAIRSGSEIQYLSVNANGQSFWLNKNTTTYCPSSVVPCPNNTTPYTTFTSWNTGTLSLDVSVPGGQQVYVTSEGQLKFTQAHSGYTGNGSLVTGFQIVDGALQFENNDWFACPLGAQNGNAYGVWAVSRVTGSQAGAACLGFRFRTLNATDVQTVWQYV